MSSTTTTNNDGDASTTPPEAKKAKTTTTTPTASDVYDRQIRLWGAESQAKMQKAKILYVHITGLSAEVIKNLVLAGVAATIWDPRPSRVLYEAPHFLTPTKVRPEEALELSVAQAVQPVIQELNPLLGECPILSGEKAISDWTTDDLKEYTAIVASHVSLEDAQHIYKISAKHTHFYMGDCFGLYGAVVIDLKPDFQYRPEQGKKLLDPTPLKAYATLQEITSTPLSECINRFHKTPPKAWVLYRCLLDYFATTQTWPATDTTPPDDDDEKKEFDKQVVTKFLASQGISNPETLQEILSLVGTVGMAQVAPVCAVLGGLLGNEIIKAVSGKGEPANNTLLFDGTICKAWSFFVQPSNK